MRIVGLLYERALRNGVEGEEGAIALYNEMKTGDYKIYKLDVGEGQLNALGYRLLENNKLKEAIGIFEFMVSEYPESYNAYLSLGGALMIAGKKDLALESLNKSFELNPRKHNAEGQLNSLGYRLLGNNKLKEAIEIFKFIVLEYPESANAYDSLGEACMTAGEKELAIKNYEKSLELNPKNENAKKMLDDLRKK